MEIGDFIEGIGLFFSIVGLIIILPPIFIYKLIKFLKE